MSWPLAWVKVMDLAIFLKKIPTSHSNERTTRSKHEPVGGVIMKMIRTTRDGKLSLADLIAEYTNTTHSNARIHIRRLTDNKLIRPCERFRFGRGTCTQIVTKDEWLAIQPLLSPASGLYVLQYSTVWDRVKIGRAQNIDDRVRSLVVGHNLQHEIFVLPPWLRASRAARPQAASGISEYR